MKVLHIINNLSSGGAERMVSEILPVMNSMKHVNAELLLLTRQGNVFENKVLEGCRTSSLDARSIRDPMNVFRIRSYLQNNNYDIVHAHLFPTQYFVALASLMVKNSPYLVTTEHSTWNRRRNVKCLRSVEKWMYARYHSIISISDETQENLCAHLGFEQPFPSKFCVINNGIDLSKFPAQPSDLGAIDPRLKKGRSRVVVMVARFGQQKDQATLIRAMKLLPDDVCLLLAGEGPLMKECRDLTQRMSLQERVFFLGFRNDVESILAASEVVILSSKWEGFGLAAAEGMAAGKSVIASNVAGLRDVVGDDELLFEVGDKEELARKISMLLDNADLYAEKAHQAKERSALFDIRSTVEGYVGVYRKLLFRELAADGARV